MPCRIFRGLRHVMWLKIWVLHQSLSMWTLQTYNMCPVDLEKKLNSTFAGVIAVDALGNPSGIGRLKEICRSYDIPLIQDSACAIGSSVDDIKVGAIADLTCYSFHST